MDKIKKKRKPMSDDNGRTLCEPCHKTTDTFGEKVKYYKEFNAN